MGDEPQLDGIWRRRVDGDADDARDLAAEVVWQEGGPEPRADSDRERAR